jgi:ribonucleoside-diphosphate reductase alpha chain
MATNLTQNERSTNGAPAPLEEGGQPVAGAAVAETWDELAERPKKMKRKLPSETEVLEQLSGGNFRIRHELLHHEGPGLRIRRHFTKPGVHPYDEITWEHREASITNDKGEVIFSQNDLEFPKFWSQMATNVVVSKYFRGQLGAPTREKSLKELIDRVAVTIAGWGFRQGIFASAEDRDIFCHELTYLLVHQMGSFNSPVWFNVGQEEYPQCSACFINSVKDTMESIMNLAKTEGMLFKYGSGTGTNLSSLRSSREHLSTGGIASGPVSFMKGYDAFAGVIKSGGKTRRAAKMVILNIGHPDIVDFIECKVKEEKKAWALIEAGYNPAFDGEAYGSVFFQNSNNSVRIPDEFMRKVKEDDEWYTTSVVGDKRMDKYRARDLLKMISESTYICGDPGLQFDTIINDWHTCADTSRINASNPCSEYMFVDDSSCNLASMNLMSFYDEYTGQFDVDSYKAAIDTFIMAQEIIVDNASYPRQEVAYNSHQYRPLGLGYTNLGALLMSQGLPYDSDEGRTYGAAVTAIMTGEAYRRSAELAQHVGPFRRFEENRNSFMRVIGKHRDAARKLDKTTLPENLATAMTDVWDSAYDMGARYGYRNAQTTVIAPTGTISFMMDADTTGIEPDLALIKYKKMVGGGYFKIVNQGVPRALTRLGYDKQTIDDIVAHIDEHETIEGAPGLKDEHLSVFDCALKPANGQRFIHHMGHINMMAAAQAFISGAISKTVNVPEATTAEEIMDAYIAAWDAGLKAIAIYRDNSKRTQPLNTAKDKVKGQEVAAYKPQRRKLADERHSLTHKFSIAGHEGYLTVGMFEDGQPGEIFLVMSKEGSTISGLMDGFATMTSLALQYGVPLDTLISKFSHMRFEPSGFTQNPEIPMAKSIYDYIFRWLASKFLDPQLQKDVGNQVQPTITNGAASYEELAQYPKIKSNVQQISLPFKNQEDAPPCPECGEIMMRSGSCYRCMNCGTQHGCS